MTTKVADFQSIILKLASPEEILDWSHGEVLKPETINYRTQRPEKDGLFCEKIFGPEKDWECYCGKYRRIRYKGVVCDRCGVEVTRAIVRRERMGHIGLAVPVSHIWFLRGIPSKMGLLLDRSVQELEKVIYFAGYIIRRVDEEARKKAVEEIEREYKVKVKGQKEKKKNVILEGGAKRRPIESRGKQLATGSYRSPNGSLQDDKGRLKEQRDRAIRQVRELHRLQILSELEYRDLAIKYGQVFEAGTGAETLRKIFEEINLEALTKELSKRAQEATPVLERRILRRLRLIEGMMRAKVRPEWMFLTTLPVLPPDLRPMVQLDGGRYATSDVNDLYRRVINRNNRLKRLIELNAPEVIRRNEKRMLQEAVDALIDNTARRGQSAVTATTGQRRVLRSLADMLKGKQGRFRQNLLGKRVDYSGRSVIVVGPDLKLHQCGLPKHMALELFKPFVINKIVERGLAYNVRGAGHMIEQETDEIWSILEEVIKDKYVLLNRAPTLHRLGIQAFQPVLIEGQAIQIHPLVCRAFNADFDGDQMAVHLPLTQAAQEEAKQVMLSSVNLLKPASGEPVAFPTHDMVLGCYWMTKIEDGLKGQGKIFSSINEAILAYHFREVELRSRIKVRISTDRAGDRAGDIPRQSRGMSPAPGLIETSVGRLIFNEPLPSEIGFLNKTMNLRELRRLIAECIHHCGIAKTALILDRIKRMGFKYATMSGITWSMADLRIPQAKEKLLKEAEKEIQTIQSQYEQGLLTEQERRTRVVQVWLEVKERIAQEASLTLEPGGPIYSIFDSGSRGSRDQLVQMVGMKGLVVSPTGETIELPVKSSLKEGFNVLEYFIATHGARKGLTDTALKTSSAGYLTRRLVDVCQDIVVREEDCGDKEGITIYRKDEEEMGHKLASRIVGRVSLEEVRAAAGDQKKSLPKGRTPEISEDTGYSTQYKKNRVKNPVTSEKLGSDPLVKPGQLIDQAMAKKIDQAGIDKIRVRSVITCRAQSGICQKCYGYDLGHNRLIKLGEAVGIVTAQAIGEPGTQLTLRTFHTGGVAGGADITQGLPRVEELFEVRTPKGRAIISEADGQVLEVVEKGEQRIVKIKPTSVIASEAKQSRRKQSATGLLRRSAPRNDSKKKVLEYSVPKGLGIWVSPGDLVSRGQQLIEGHIDLKELYKTAGQEAVQRYIIREVQSIYTAEGERINDKHIEMIIRQMFSRVRIQDPGQTNLLAGQIVERSVFEQENARVAGKKTKTKTKAKGKLATAQPLLLGITKVSLSSDSFLSAASFQETAKVLINAAIEGKGDHLRGLKENVIIGKLIPAGTGFTR